MLLNGIRGFCMALADNVPGVSKGAIAFLLGFYDTFIKSLNDLMGRDNGRRKTAFLFLTKLGVGWVIDFCMSVLILSSLFEVYIYRVSSPFLGLTLFAIPMVIREEEKALKDRYGNIMFTPVGALPVLYITYFNLFGGGGISISVEHLSLGPVVYVFFTVTVAIVTMVLPGISGSTLLLIFGLYMPIIGAMKEFLHMSVNYFPILMVSGLDVVTRTVGITKIIKICLERYCLQAICTIIGLMTGSFHTTTMRLTTLDMPRTLMGPSAFSILFLLPGGVILAGLRLLKVHPDWFAPF